MRCAQEPGPLWLLTCNCTPPSGDHLCGERQNVGSPSLKASGLPPGLFFCPPLATVIARGILPTMPKPFDPLAWLASKDTEAFLDPAGQVQLRFGQFVRSEDRKRIRRVIAHYEDLLRLQLDVEPGTRPRSAYQLLASGRLKIVGGQYMVRIT